MRVLAAATAAAVSFSLCALGSSAASAATSGAAASLSGTAGASSLLSESLVSINGTTSSEGFTHPGIGVTAENLAVARQQVRAGVEPWATYFATMAKTGYASIALTSKNSSAAIDQPGTNAFTGRGTESKLIEDSWGAYTQAILYYITGNAVYRANSMKIIRIWSHLDPTKFAYFADSQIHTGVPLYRLLAAAELLRYTSVDAGYSAYDLTWHDTDTASLTTNLIDPMTATFLYQNTNYFNQHLYPLIGALAGYIFTDNRTRYTQGVEWFTVNATTTKPDQNGAIAGVFKSIGAADPMNGYGYSFVQHQEMGRDQAHSGGDVASLAGLARMLSVQGTKVDPVAGTASTATDAVTAYAFLGDRILGGANAYDQFMLGYDTPWVDVTGGSAKVSDAYRGRLFLPLDELYYAYKYQEGVDVEKVAPYLAEAHRKAVGPLFYNGATVSNFWGGVDTGPEYWLSLPSAVAGQVPAAIGDPNLQIENRSIAVSGTSSIKSDGGRTYVRMSASRAGSTIAVNDIVYQDRTKASAIGLQIRTTSSSSLEVSKDQHTASYLTLTVPNTHGQWRYLSFDISAAAVPLNRTGDNIIYFHVVGAPRASVDFDYLNLLAASQLSPPTFPQGTHRTIVGVQLAAMTASFGAIDTNSVETVTYGAEGLPAGARLDVTTGAFAWTPTARQQGTHTFLVVASDGTVDSVQDVTIEVASDRATAYQEALAGYDQKLDYTSTSLASFAIVQAQVEASASTANDADFLAALVTLQEAVRALELLNPVLAGDLSLNYPELVTSTLPAAKLSNLTDFSYNTSGDVTIPGGKPSFTLDFGARYRVTADSFGLQARYMFANRSQGTNVYGSNDNQTWTLLTARETTNTAGNDYAMEVIPVLPAVADQQFRYVRAQVDAPGVDTDPAYPGIWSIGEFHIFGARLEVPTTAPLT